VLGTYNSETPMFEEKYLKEEVSPPKILFSGSSDQYQAHFLKIK
jgi:hypothetical protein